jgi:hypothetical protein
VCQSRANAPQQKQRYSITSGCYERDREPLTINHRERLWERRSEIATAPIGIFPQKKLEASPPADVPPWSQKPSSD